MLFKHEECSFYVCPLYKDSCWGKNCAMWRWFDPPYETCLPDDERATHDTVVLDSENKHRKGFCGLGGTVLYKV